MRLWSLHPKYLDNKGLIALWREALLAKAVLEGKTIGYKNHPQLNRFRESDNPIGCINQYLEHIYYDSVRRGYHFDKKKYESMSHPNVLKVNDKQIEYELKHLSDKLIARDKPAYNYLSAQNNIDAHPLFSITEGEVEDWEVLRL